MPDEHALLSPSASERWIHCPASVRMAAQVPPQPDSPYAAEGTHAHSWGEALARQELLGRGVPREEWLALERHALDNGWDPDEMQRHAEGYVSLLEERLARYPHSQLLLEQRVQTGIEGCWGTSDAIIVSPQHVEIVDLKYGKGVRVDAPGNTQLMLYGVGALEGYGDVLGLTEEVFFTVYQPRLDHTSTDHLSAGDLRAWRDSIIPLAEEALAGSTRFGPSESACRWCPAAGICTARRDYLLDQDFGSVDVMTVEDMAAMLERIPEIRDWCDAVQEAALDVAYRQGRPIPGWKVVQSRGQRKVTDPEGAQYNLRREGYSDEDFMDTRLKGITALEKLVGKGNLETVLGDALGRTEGRPSLVHTDDPRPPTSPLAGALEDFSD